MKLVLTLSLVLCLAVTLMSASPVVLSQNETRIIDGFSRQRTETQLSLEQRFRAVPKPDSAREHLRILTREPHIAGSKKTTRPPSTCAINCEATVLPPS